MQAWVRTISHSNYWKCQTKSGSLVHIFKNLSPNIFLPCRNTKGAIHRKYFHQNICPQITGHCLPKWVLGDGRVWPSQLVRISSWSVGIGLQSVQCLCPWLLRWACLFWVTLWMWPPPKETGVTWPTCPRFKANIILLSTHRGLYPVTSGYH